MSSYRGEERAVKFGEVACLFIFKFQPYQEFKVSFPSGLEVGRIRDRRCEERCLAIAEIVDSSWLIMCTGTR